MEDKSEAQSASWIQQPVADSPMEWPWLQKHTILIQAAFHAAGPGFTSSLLIPATEQLAEQFEISTQKATYLVGVHVLFLGLGPFLWNPLLGAYGRRPVFIGSMLLSCAAALGGGFANGYGTLMTARVFQSIGISTGFVIPGVIVVDLFKPEERGSKNGVWAQMVSLGAPLGGLIGGPVVSYIGWRWVMWIISIVCGAQLLGFILTCPETSYIHRKRSGLGAYHPSELISLPKRVPGQLGWQSFIEPILLFQSPNVVLIAFAYGVTFAITSPGIATILPIALGDVYDFDSIAQGLFFLAPLVGIILAERLAGPGSDWAMNRERRRAATTNRQEHPESRLWFGLPGYAMSVIGVIIFGVTLQARVHWIGPCIGFGISNFGLQLVTTPLKTYCVDCHAERSGSVLQMINVIRQVISFTVPFWSPNLNESLGYAAGFGVEAAILGVFYMLSLLVLWMGASWRGSARIRRRDIH
ncbi:major facilitator superfamily domain-containing protein [Aspergillus californicus]